MIDMNTIKPGDTLECCWEYSQVQANGNTRVICLGTCVIVESTRNAFPLLNPPHRTAYFTIRKGFDEIEISESDAQKHFRPYVSSVTMRIPTAVPSVPITVQVYGHGVPPEIQVKQENKAPYQVDLDWEDYDYYGNYL